MTRVEDSTSRATRVRQAIAWSPALGRLVSEVNAVYREACRQADYVPDRGPDLVTRRTLPFALWRNLWDGVDPEAGLPIGGLAVVNRRLAEVYARNPEAVEAAAASYAWSTVECVPALAHATRPEAGGR